MDATIATAPHTGFAHSRGHRMVATSWTGILAPLGVADRPRLESEYSLYKTLFE